MNGTVEDSSVSNLNYVVAPNYAAGFIGHMGKNGGVSADEAQVTNEDITGKLLTALGLDLGANAQVLGIVGSTVERCSVDGYADGFITSTTGTQVPIADVVSTDDLTGTCSAGFCGFADISQIEDCTVRNYKYGEGNQIAAGFVGRTSVSFLGDVQVSSKLTEIVVKIVNVLVKALYLDKADLINFAPSELFGLKILSNGDVLYVNLFGLKIGVSLSKNDSEYGGQQDAAIITLGSSTIKLPCTSEGINMDNATPNVSITLFEANRTAVRRSSVRGVTDGYDILGGGATQAQTGDTETDGTDDLGYAGGFVGYNNNGFFSNDEMVLCDVVKGTPNKVGPFVGASQFNTRDQDYLEGKGNGSSYNNRYHIYRKYDESYTRISRDNKQLNSDYLSVNDTDTGRGTAWMRYDMQHYAPVANTSEHLVYQSLQNAVANSNPGEEDLVLGAYETSAKAVLMSDKKLAANGPGNTIQPDELKDPCDILIDLTVNKRWERDLFGLAGTRPASVTVHVYRKDVGENPPDVLIKAESPEGTYEELNESPLTLSDANTGWPHTEAWKQTVKGLPIAYEFEDQNTNETTVHYYQYYVVEEPVENYKTTYEVIQSTASVNITNEYDNNMLPDLGGPGGLKRVSVVLLTAILALGYVIFRRVKTAVEEVSE